MASSEEIDCPVILSMDCGVFPCLTDRGPITGSCCLSDPVSVISYYYFNIEIFTSKGKTLTFRHSHSTLDSMNVCGTGILEKSMESAAF